MIDSMSQHARHSASTHQRRLPWWRRMARGARQIIVLCLLAAVILALGTTVTHLPESGAAAGPGTTPEDGEQPRPRVEEHVALLAELVADERPEGLSDAAAEALLRHPDLMGPPERTEPLFDWLPVPEPPESSVPETASLAPFPEIVELAARGTLTRATTVTVDPEARTAEGDVVPPERLRTLVGVGLEQLEVLGELDPEAAAAVRTELLTENPGNDAAATVAQDACPAVESAAGTAYELAYLYEYTAVRTRTDREDDDAAGAWRWQAATERAATGDELARLLPEGCVAPREAAYPVPADGELADHAAALELRLALELREAAAAAAPAARGRLLDRALAAAGVTGQDWVGFAVPEAD